MNFYFEILHAAHYPTAQDQQISKEISKHLDLKIKDQSEIHDTETFIDTVTESPVESVSVSHVPAEISPVRDELMVDKIKISLGHSPSDFIFEEETQDTTINKLKTNMGLFTQESKDSLFDDDARDLTKSGQLNQFEKIYSKESSHEHKSTVVSSSVEQKTIYKEEIEGEEPKVVMEEKVFSTEDKEDYSKYSESKKEVTLRTSETIQDDIEIQDDGSEVKRELKELVAAVEENSQSTTDETTTKALKKTEEVKETVYPFTKDLNGKKEEHLVDTVSRNEETLQTTLHTVTDLDTHKTDETRLTSERQIKGEGDDEKIVEGSEKYAEERQQNVMEKLKEKVTAEEEFISEKDRSETLFNVKHEFGQKAEIDPVQERHEHTSEHALQTQTFESDVTRTENFGFTDDRATKSEELDIEAEKADHYHRKQRDSGLFEETFSDDSDSDGPQRMQELETMAFDNMAFNDEEVVRPKEVNKSITFMEEFGKAGEISPEDLKESLTKFDFTEELKEEMHENEQTRDDDRTLSLSGTDFEEKKNQYMATPLDVEELPADEADKCTAKGRATDSVVGPTEVQGAVSQSLAVYQQHPTQEILETDSPTSSSSNENEVFDHVSGKFVHWEIQHQYSRQFSDSYSEQGQKDLEKSASSKSLDMGEFYRRDEPVQDVHEILPITGENKDKSTDETSPASKKKIQRVRFSLSEDHTEYYERDVEEPVHSYDIRMTEEWEKVGETREKHESSEPHEKITEAYQQAVIASIIETRILNEQERQKYLQNLDTIDHDSVEFGVASQVKVPLTDAASYSSSISSTEIEFQEVEEGDDSEDDEDTNIEMISTMSQAVQTSEPQPLSVVSRESRLAHEELLKESFDEKDRSVSPSIDSEELSTTYESQIELQEELDVTALARKYPVTVQVQGKAISSSEDFGLLESDRNLGDDERLSPIEETSGDDVEGAEIKVDKKVTFQTDTQHLCSVSSEDHVKTSTSSSEFEPTLLAASYDLESGRVSHVVTSYDLSPDAVEKQFLPVVQPPKTILSSPEDDVFEADLTLGDTNDNTVIEQTPTDAEVELLPADSTDENGGQKHLESASAGTSSLPSPPVPSPFETSQIEDHTASDLQDAAIRMKELKGQGSLDTVVSEKSIEIELYQTKDKKYDSDECESPFEIMSPSDLEGFEEYAERQKRFEEKMLQSFTSQTSSFGELNIEDVEQQRMPPAAVGLVGTAMLSPDKSLNESSFDHSSLVSSETSERGPESPTEIPEPQSLCISLQPDLVETAPAPVEEKLPNGPTEVEYNPEIDTDIVTPDSHYVASQQESDQMEQVVMEASYNVVQSSQLTGSQVTVTGSASATQPSDMTEGIIEELPAQSGQDSLIVSDQTLYGLEMPSDEAASMTTSHLEYDSLNVSAYTSTSVQDDTLGMVDSREAFSQAVGIDRTDEDLSERPSESLQDLPISPVTEESHDTVKGETVVEKAMTSAIPSTESQTYHDVERDQKGQLKRDLDYLSKQSEDKPEATLKGYEVTVQEIDDVDLERRTPETFLDDELDEELLQLKETPENDVDPRLEDDTEREAAGSAEERGRFELKADSCDLDRPLTPTPVDKKQGFFEETFTPDEAKKLDEAVAIQREHEITLGTKDHLLEKTACDFVENVLEEVKVKVRFKTVLDVDDDVALVQSPLSENGGDMTDFADDLPYDESDDSEELPDDNKMLDKDITHIQKDTGEEKSVDIMLEITPKNKVQDQALVEKEDITCVLEQHERALEETADFVDCQGHVSAETDSEKQLIEEETFCIAESSSFVETSLPLATKADFGKVCVPEEGDLVEQEIEKSETDGLTGCLPEEKDESDLVCTSHEESTSAEMLIQTVTDSTTVSTISEATLSTQSHSITESNRFLGKSSDSSSYSVCSVKETENVHTSQMSSEHVTEQALKSEQSMIVLPGTVGKPEDKAIHMHISDKFHEGVEKTFHEPTLSAIPMRKSLSVGSTDSLDEEKSAGKSIDLEDAGDSSSVDSFTTVVAADEEEVDDDDRMADFASLTSSIHSDIQGGGLTDDMEPFTEKDPLQELMAWAQDKKVKDSFQSSKDIEEEEMVDEKDKEEDMFPWNKDGAHVIGILPHPWRKDDEDSDSLGGSDRYDYVDRTALSVITELSDEDRFEIINKEEIESESTGSGTGTGSDSRHYSSPDFPPPSPMSNLKFFSKSGEKDDISVSSSLLEFERLEREINQSRSSGSIENGSKDSFGGSLDETKFLSKSLEKDDNSISSSLADFERLEREVAQGSSDSSIEKIFSPAVASPPETGKCSEKSSVSGSMTSLTEFERLEKEIMNGESRRSTGSVESSFSHVSITSITSSQASLNEFERLEQEFNIAEELEREAQKIVSILEAGTLLPTQYSSEPELSHSESLTTRETIITKSRNKEDEMDRDSVEGKDDMEEDSLSENKKRMKGDTFEDTDSLEGDRSEMTSSITSAILKSESATKIGTEHDLDSLLDSTHSSDGAMKISSDSLGEKLGVVKTDTDKFETDSLSDQEGEVDETVDSKQDTMQKSTDSLELKETVMEKSTDSLELDEKEQEKFETDSLGGAEEAMQESVDSLESYQIVPKHNVMEISMESAGTGWSSASSMFSRSSIDTMRSAEREEQTEVVESQTCDVMEASMESWEEYGGEEETDNFYIISKYQSSLKEAAEYGKSSRTERSEYTHPYYDFEHNVAADNFQYMMTGPDWDRNFGSSGSDTSPYLAKQPYEEKKKIYTMTEWEAMKKAKKQQAEEEERKLKEQAEQSEKQESPSKEKSDLSESTSDEQSEISGSISEEKKGDSEGPMELSSDSGSMMERTLTSSHIETETDSSETKHIKSQIVEIKTEQTNVEMRKTQTLKTKVKFDSKTMTGIMLCCIVVRVL